MSYLQHKKSANYFSSGAYHLLKISEASFNDFTYNYENNNIFKKFIDNLYTSDLRELKINDLLDEPTRRNRSK